MSPLDFCVVVVVRSPLLIHLFHETFRLPLRDVLRLHDPLNPHCLRAVDEKRVAAGNFLKDNIRTPPHKDAGLLLLCDLADGNGLDDKKLLRCQDTFIHRCRGWVPNGYPENICIVTGFFPAADIFFRYVRHLSHSGDQLFVKKLYTQIF